MNMWWFNRLDVNLSPQERRAKMGIGVLSIPVCFLLFTIEIIVLHRFGLNEHTIAFASFVFSVFPSALIARLIYGKVWPNFMKAADEKAEERLSGRRSNETNPSSLAQVGVENEHKRKPDAFASLVTGCFCFPAIALFLIAGFLPTPYRVEAKDAALLLMGLWIPALLITNKFRFGTFKGPYRPKKSGRKWYEKIED